MSSLLGAVTLSTQCCAQIFDDPFSQYVERSITITPGRIELVADEIIIRGRSKVQIHGDDIDNNPG